MATDAQMERAIQLLDQLVRLSAVTIRSASETQTEAILLLLDAGLEPARVAELVGTSADTVRATRTKARAKR